MCALGSEGFREVVGYVFVRWNVLILDRSSLYLVLYEVVFDVNEFSTFRRSRVLSDEDCGLVVYEQGVGWVPACGQRWGGDGASVRVVLPPWLQRIRLHT